MPSPLWDFFWYNRTLLNQIGKIAANCIQTIANKKNVTPGIFIAIHTFGRDLKRNIHIHLSTTTGGLTDHGTWEKLFFDQAALMRMWRYQIIKLFRQAYQKQKLSLPSAIQKQLHPSFPFHQFHNLLYQKTWIVHCSKPSHDHHHNVRYLGGYLKRPAMAESKLKHYDGFEVTFKYLDHRSKTYCQFKLTADEFIGRLVQHIPDTHFRMIRYYGFLAHRVRGKCLPIVYQLLNQVNVKITAQLTYAQLIQKDFNVNPLTCILCGQQLMRSAIFFGKSTAHELLPFHRQLALLQKI